MLTPQQVEHVQKALATAQKPLFFYDDDPDGVCSFLLLYRVHREGIGVIVKSSPSLGPLFLRKVEECQPDKIFVLDVPNVKQEFIDTAKTPMFWIDHHQPVRRKNIYYCNPRITEPDIYIPTSRMAYQLSNLPEDLWIAAVGCVADYYLPDFIEEVEKKYPSLLNNKKDLPSLLYESPLGKLVRIFSFLLKGQNSDVYKCVKILTRIGSPEEILQQKTAAGKFLYQRFEKINEKYEILIRQAKQSVTRSKILLFQYTEQQWSFTSDLANELSAKYPKKVILIAREKSGEMKCSLRAKFPIAGALEKALEDLRGYGGGHPHACGAVIAVKDWKTFLERFKREI